MAGNFANPKTKPEALNTTKIESFKKIQVPKSTQHFGMDFYSLNRGPQYFRFTKL